MVRRDDIFDQELVQALSVVAHPEDGPTDEELLEAVEARLEGLPGPDLGGCDHCLSVVGAVAEAVAEWERQPLDAVQQAVRRTADVVFRLAGDTLAFLSGSVVPTPVPAGAVTRSAGAAAAPVGLHELSLPLDVGAVHVVVERTSGGGCELAMELAGAARGRSMRATLHRGPKLVESAPFEEDRVHFSGLGAHVYRVEVHEGQQLRGSLRIRFLDS